MSVPISLEKPSLIGLAASPVLVVYPSKRFNVFVAESIGDLSKVFLDASRVGEVIKVAVAKAGSLGNQAAILGTEGILIWDIGSEELDIVGEPLFYSGYVADAIYDKGWVIAELKDAILLTVRLKIDENGAATPDVSSGKPLQTDTEIYYFNKSFNYNLSAPGPIASVPVEEIFVTSDSVIIDDATFGYPPITSFSVLDKSKIIAIGCQKELIALSYEGKEFRTAVQHPPLAVSITTSLDDDQSYSVYYVTAKGVYSLTIEASEVENEHLETPAQPGGDARPLQSGFVQRLATASHESTPEPSKLSVGSGIDRQTAGSSTPSTWPDASLSPRMPSKVEDSPSDDDMDLSDDLADNADTAEIDADLAQERDPAEWVARSEFDLVVTNLKNQIKALEAQIEDLMDENEAASLGTPPPAAGDDVPNNSKAKKTQPKSFHEAIDMTMRGQSALNYLEKRPELSRYLSETTPAKAQMIRLALISAYAGSNLAQRLLSQLGPPLIDAKLYYTVVEDAHKRSSRRGPSRT